MVALDGINIDQVTYDFWANPKIDWLRLFVRLLQCARIQLSIGLNLLRKCIHAIALFRIET